MNLLRVFWSWLQHPYDRDWNRSNDRREQLQLEFDREMQLFEEDGDPKHLDAAQACLYEAKQIVRDHELKFPEVFR